MIFDKDGEGFKTQKEISGRKGHDHQHDWNHKDNLNDFDAENKFQKAKNDISEFFFGKNNTNEPRNSFELGSTEFYFLIATIVVIFILVGLLIYFFLCKKKPISMSRNRRAQVRPISRRIRKTQSPRTATPADTVQETTTNGHRDYAEIEVSAIQPSCPAENPPPSYADLSHEVKYAQIDIR